MLERESHHLHTKRVCTFEWQFETFRVDTMVFNDVNVTCRNSPLSSPGHLLQVEANETDWTGPDLVMLRLPGL